MPRNTHNAGPMVLVSLSPPPLNPAATRQHNTHIQQGKHALRRCPPPPAPPPLLHYTEASERFVGYDKMYRYVLAQKRTRLPQGGSRECVALVCMAAPKRGMKCTCSQCPTRKRGTGERYTPQRSARPHKDRFVLYCLLRELLREPCPPVFPRARTGRRRGCVYVKEM